jgi:membrane-bound lytic murein transglycosylase
MTSGGRRFHPSQTLIAAFAAAMLSVSANAAESNPKSNIKIGNSELEPVEWATIDGWAEDDHAAAFKTFMVSCNAILRAGPSARPDRPVFRGLHQACQAAAQAAPKDAKEARTFFEENFRPVRITPEGETAGFLTGYYEPIVDGSLEPSEEFAHPLYRTPPGLRRGIAARANASKAKAAKAAKSKAAKSKPAKSKPAKSKPAKAAKASATDGKGPAKSKAAAKSAAKSATKSAAKSAAAAAKSATGKKKTAKKRGGRKGGKFYDRAAIEDGALKGRDLEIVYLKDPVDSFFIHIQGSARVRLAGGGMMRVNYDSQNGHKYTAVGRFLIDRDIISKEEMSMERIRQWMNANPEEAKELRRKNLSYVFFRQTNLSENEEPVGAQGVSLTAGRSIAVDRNLHVYGTPFFIQAELPIESEAPTTRWRRLMIAQDTGGAIVGPARADIYYGAGEPAGVISGRFKQPGQFVMLLPKSLDPFAKLREIPLPKPRPANIPQDDKPAKPAVVAVAKPDAKKPDAKKPADVKKPEAKKPAEAKKDDAKKPAAKPNAKQASVKPADKPADKPAEKPAASKPAAKKPAVAAPKRPRDLAPPPPI